jgi:glutamate--cysteine ligase
MIAHGVEKEALRVMKGGELARSFHPLGLGSKLTHPFITTDYAEALLEFVTPVQKCHDSTINLLKNLHGMVYHHAPTELIWPVSMPCILPEDEHINIADYGASNSGQMKNIYRLGLGERYGRSMQTIAGIHYNFSISKKWFKEDAKNCADEECLIQFMNKKYFHLIRNFKRYSWVISYFFGATPVVDKSFLLGKKHNLSKINKNTYGSEFATSLRMGGLGYTSSAQSSIKVCFNQLDSYVRSIDEARSSLYEPYDRIGLYKNNRQVQLTTNLLQIDNEFYSTIRPKRVRLPNENSLKAVYDRGIEYIEVRLMDVNPFADVGLTSDQMKFLDAFLLFCLNEDSPFLEAKECELVERNYQQIVINGRDPKLTLENDSKQKSVVTFASEILEKMQLAANRFNINWNDDWKNYLDPTKVLSAKFFDLMQGCDSYSEWVLKRAFEVKEKILSDELSEKKIAYFNSIAQDSIEEQKEIELSDTLSFSEYLSNFYKITKIS